MAVLVQLSDGVATNKFPIGKDRLSLGRAPSNDVYIDDPMVSSRHALIKVEADPDDETERVFYIRDLNSTNGTFVNEQRVEFQRLNNEDVIRCGLHDFKFLDESREDVDKTKRIKKSWIPGVYYTKD